MSQRDLLIWRRWYTTIARDVVNLYFDVGLGPGPYVPPKTDKNLAAMWTRLNQKRADVVFEYLDRVIIVELRSHASASAIGRLLLYRVLYLQDPLLGSNVETWLVTDQIDDTTKAVAQAHQIKVTVVY